MKNALAIMSLFFFSSLSDGQKLAYVPPSENTVFLEQVCKAKERTKFWLQNNTKWAISVETTSLYADFQKYSKLKLENGGSLFVLNDKQELDDLFHWILQEKSNKHPATFSIISMAGHTGAVSWIAPGKSVYFWVGSKYLGQNSTVYTVFKYEWELSYNGTYGNYLQHRVYDYTSSPITKKCQ